MELIFSGFAQHVLQEGTPEKLQIYSGEGLLPNGFQAGTIRLDASETSSLKWEVETDLAHILWELDLGLTLALIEDEARYMTLELAVDHFSKTVWPRYAKQTLGVILYKGLFDERLLDPLKLLAARLPESVRPFVLFDTAPLTDPKKYFLALNGVQLGFLTPVLKGKWPEKYPYAFPSFAWDHPNSPLGIFSDVPYPPLPSRRLPVAVLIPEKGDFPLLEIPVRYIPEQILTHEWEGVEQLIVVRAALSERTHRKLRGFEAAGGEVLFIDSQGDEALLPLQEISPDASLAAWH